MNKHKYILHTLLEYYLRETYNITAIREIKDKTTYGKWIVEDYIINYLNGINP